MRRTKKIRRWYLVSMDVGILDSADTKRSLMARNGIVTTVREGPVYLADKDCSDGIGGSSYLIPDIEMVRQGFGEDLEEYEGELR